MASLSDQIDRFGRSSKAIKAIAANTALAHVVAGPFTRAVLDAHLGDLIRDVDPSELGLFQLIGPENDTYSSQVARVEFGNASPLKRNLQKRDDHIKHDVEPETYAQAALKYIDRYDPIREMPRTRFQAISVLRRLDDVRQSIRTLLQSLEQVQSEEMPPLKLLIKREEEHTNEVKAEIAELQQRKKIALDRCRPVQESTTLQAKQKVSKFDLRPDPELERTPIAAAKTLHFSDNLMDETLDLSHISNVSMTTHELDPPPSDGEGRIYRAGQTMAVEIQHGNASEEARALDNASTSGMEDCDDSGRSHSSPQATLKKLSDSDSKIQIKEETERIAMKIWQTASDIMGPIHQLEISGSIELPSAKEILARLKLLSQSNISPTSPSIATETSSSTTATAPPTSQQILTAHLLLTLLFAPHCSLPLNKVKEILTVRAGGGGQSTSRVIYGCVAKRLVKIDRSGREQIVKFDI